MANTIYRQEWKGIHTGWEYRLDIYDSSDTILNSPTIILLEPGTVITLKLDVGYNKYRIGMPSIPMMNLSINLDLIPDTATYHPLIDSLLYPVKLTYVNDNNMVQYELERGTVFRLYSKFNGNSGTTDYREIFTGIQRKGIEGGNWGIDTGVIEVEAEQINTVALSQLKMAEVLGRIADNFILVKKKALIYTFLNVSGDKRQLVGFTPSIYQNNNIPADLFHVKLCSLSELFESAAQLAALYHTALLRTSDSFSYSIDAMQLSYYKQLLDGSGAIGGSIPQSALYLLHSIVSDSYTYTPEGGSETTISAATYYSIADEGKDTFIDKYPYFWDFYSEHSEGQIGFVDFMGNETVELRPIFYTTDEVTIDFVNNFEVDNIGGETISNVTASLQENVGDDIDKFELNSARKSQNSFNLPIFLNNMGAAVSYKDWEYSANSNPETINSGIGSVAPTNPACLKYDSNYNGAYHFRYVKKVTEEHLFDLYYLDDQDLYWAAILSMPFKVHEFVSVAVGDGTNSKDISGCTLNAFDITSPYDYLENGKPTEMYMEMQKETFAPALLPKIINKFFGNKKFAKIKIEVNIDQYTNFQTGGSLGFVWWNKLFSTKFIYDLTQYHSRLADLGSDWFALKCELNLESETATVELFNKVI